MAPRASSESSENRTGEMPIRRARAAADEVSGARPPAQTKRGRHDDVEVDPAPPPSAPLRVRMDKELVALQGLVKRAKLILPRSGSGPPAAAEKKCAPAAPRGSESEAALVSSSPSSAEKRRASPLKPPTEAPAAAKQQQQRPVQRVAADKKTDQAPKKRRRQEEEVARAAAREEFRRMLLEMERAALPDETIYPEDLKELGIAFEHVVTRTKKAWLEDHRRMPAAATATLHGGVGTTTVVGIVV